MAKFDMNAMLKQAQQMQAQMMEAQEQAKLEIVEASAGGGMVTVKANGGGEIVEIRIDPKAIDPDDPEMLADIVMAAANEALRSASDLVESKIRGQMPDLGGLGIPGAAGGVRLARRAAERGWAGHPCAGGAAASSRSPRRRGRRPRAAARSGAA